MRYLVALLLAAACRPSPTDAERDPPLEVPEVPADTPVAPPDAPEDTPAGPPQDEPAETDPGGGCDPALGSPEVCNGVDDDCDGAVDNGVCALGDACSTDGECSVGFCLAAGSLVLAWRPPVCSQDCFIFADLDSDRVNDADAPGELCEPSDLPFRCMDISSVGQNPVAVCLPGETLAVCQDASTCAAGEQCVEIFAPRDFTKRCIR
jgi:hypothetical protein